jgi:hypothetical protein
VPLNDGEAEQVMDDDELDDIERRIRELSNQYPNAVESVALHRQLQRCKHDAADHARYAHALVMLKKVGFRLGRRETSLT